MSHRPAPARMARRRWLGAALHASVLGGLVVSGGRVAAAPGGLPPTPEHAAGSPVWDKVLASLVRGRAPVRDPARLAIEAPTRAAFGAAVPVVVRSRLDQRGPQGVRRLHLVVDANPSPVAATFEMSPEMGSASLETRLRVDAYSQVRVLAELADGTLLHDGRYVKTSGGCSAPPNRDSPELVGRTTLRLLPADEVGLARAEVVVLHPNDTGFEMNHVTVMTIPPHYVRRLRVLRDEALLFDADLDFSISENPMFRFHFDPAVPARELRAEVVDSKDFRYAGRLTLGPSS